MFKLDELGIKFSFGYTRNANFEIRPGKVVTDITHCYLSVGDMTYQDISCCAAGDPFNKAIGRKVALARTMQTAKLPKEIRKQVWNVYFNRGSNV